MKKKQHKYSNAANPNSTTIFCLKKSIDRQHLSHMQYAVSILLLCFLSHSIFSQTVSKPIVNNESYYKVEVFFETGSFQITPEAEADLQELVKYKAQTGMSLRITAHTDSIGSVDSNLQLSKDRAKAVKDRIILLGLNIDSLFVNYFGEEQPRSANADEQGRQDNRRCTVELTSKKGQLVWVNGVVQDSMKQPLKAKVIIKTKETENETETDSLGQYRLKVPFNKVASLEIYPEDHFYDTKMFKTTPGEKDLKMNFQPLTVGSKIRLNNFYFVGGQAVLLKRSKPELIRLLQFMKNMPDLKINIIGHVNEPGLHKIKKSSSSFRLSVKRAALINDYLLNNRIAPSRLKFEGRGNWEMKFPLAKTEMQMEYNRRVEIKVLGK